MQRLEGSRKDDIFERFISMKALEQKIIKEGKIYDGDILKVDCFLNHRIDVEFLNEIGKEFYSIYKDNGINKILTIEASGIGIACVTALNFQPIVPVVFAKKTVFFVFVTF